ncbi:MAG: hypothetical protein WAS36_05155 [Candidatus Saccharimonadales bacterium]
MVELVNDTPVKHPDRYEFDAFGYGDKCFAVGESELIGTLATGEKVMREIYPNSGGTTCPTGAEYLLPPGVIYAMAQ